MPTYARLPVAFSHGRGSRVVDVDGKEYLDGLSGIAVNTLGHAHPDLVAAIADQAGKLLHCSNLYEITLQQQLADRLCALSGMAVRMPVAGFVTPGPRRQRRCRTGRSACPRPQP